MKRRSTTPGTNGNGKAKAKATPAPKPERIPDVLVPEPLFAELVAYLESRPYREVAGALAALATQCRTEKGAPIGRVNPQTEAPTDA